MPTGSTDHLEDLIAVQIVDDRLPVTLDSP